MFERDVSRSYEYTFYNNMNNSSLVLCYITLRYQMINFPYKRVWIKQVFLEENLKINSGTNEVLGNLLNLLQYDFEINYMQTRNNECRSQFFPYPQVLHHFAQLSLSLILAPTEDLLEDCL